MSKLKTKPQIELTLRLTLDANRVAWLQLAADARGWDLIEFAEALLHNASLDFQQGRWPESDPDDYPSDVFSGHAVKIE